MPARTTTPPPPVGTVIDDGALKLVEVLGYGGYGVVFRAVDLRSRGARAQSYAVKCLTHSQSARQRQLHMREIALHRLASSHQNVVTLHRVVEDAAYPEFTFIIMDFCPDGDLFSQILHHRTYLGYDRLIKHVFLQLLDSVEHCHSLGIYHRDLKPENILCYDGGLRVAVTDFGLATTDRQSTEFRTGSVYHMSPECQGGRFAPTGSYSPLFNDIWSLGIILLNLATGRNPWKSATLSDPTFYAYLQNPAHFLPTVLPISAEVNALLVRVLEPDWRKRATLRELRAGVRAIDNFYADDVVFEQSMARCAWEARLDAEEEEQAVTASSEEDEPVCATPPEAPVADGCKPATWNADGADSAMVFASPSQANDGASWLDLEDLPAEKLAAVLDDAVAAAAAEEAPDFEPVYSEAEEPQTTAATDVADEDDVWSTRSSSSQTEWLDADGDRSMTPSPSPSYMANALSQSLSSASSAYSTPSLPPTPRVSDAIFPPTPTTVGSFTLPGSSKRSLLTIDTTGRGYDGDSSMFSAHSSAMHTAVESWAGGAAPFESDSYFFTGYTSKAPTPIEAPLDIAMLADDEEEPEDVQSSPNSPFAFHVPAAAYSRTSLGHDADVEDVVDGSPVLSYAPHGQVFFPPPPRTPGGSSTSSGKSASGGRTAPDRGRGASRFNPLKLALRSLSPRRGTAPASRSRSPPKATRPATPGNWSPPSWAPFVTPAEAQSTFVFASAVETATAIATPARGEGLRLRPARRGWFSPGRRLFGAYAT